MQMAVQLLIIIQGEIMAQTGKTAPRKLWVLFILFLALALTACASAERAEEKTMQSLNASVEAFNSAFRWEDYSSAAAFVPADKKDLFWAEVDRFKGKIRLIEYQVREVHHAENGNRATAVVYFQYWRPESPTVQTATFTQKWYFPETGKTAKERLWKVSDSGFSAISSRNAGF